VEWAVWGGLGFIALAVVAAYIASQFKARPLPVYGSMTDFTLTNQDNQKVTLADLRGQVWIADAIFTRCPSQCLLMSGHMKEIQDALPAGLPIKLVSFTTDPDFDQAAVLKKYAERFNAHDGCWSFLTGGKSDLRHAEMDGLKLAVADKPAAEQASANDLFIHSEKFVLLDKDGRLRNWYDGQEEGAVAKVVEAAETLARE
jgi:protein SCO1/2